MARLLFDEPLSEQLCDLLADLFPSALHVRSLGHGGASDQTVWELAREHQCVVVSKDGDFCRLAVLRRAPPKFIWIRLGNCRTREVADLLKSRFEDIKQFDSQDEATVLELG